MQNGKNIKLFTIGGNDMTNLNLNVQERFVVEVQCLDENENISSVALYYKKRPDGLKELEKFKRNGHGYIDFFGFKEKLYVGLEKNCFWPIRILKETPYTYVGGKLIKKEQIRKDLLSVRQNFRLREMIGNVINTFVYFDKNNILFPYRKEDIVAG